MHKDACVWLLWSWTCHLLVKGLLVQKTRTKECHHIALFQFSYFQRSIDWPNSSFFCKLFSVLSHIIKRCTTLKNIQGILKQLSLTHIAVICNECVYNITREITKGNATEFESIVLSLATFHRTKFPGKYLRNNGAESIWTQNSEFGPNEVQSVLDGTHYARSFKGIILQYKKMERLQWLVLFKTLLSLQIMMEMKIIWIGNVR